MSIRLPRLSIYFLAAGLILQLITYSIAPDSLLSLLSGLCGVCSVVLCSSANIWTFAFGFAQILTYSYICLQEALYAEVAMNAFYFLSQFYGIYTWRRQMKNQELETRRMSYPRLCVLLVSLLGLSLLAGWGLGHWTNDSQPYMDALTTVPAIAAQILMVSAYREQWLLWLMIDTAAVVMWLRAGDYCMAAQYAFWCANCAYGYWQWTKQAGKGC